jgi:Peptidase MA superfamily
MYAKVYIMKYALIDYIYQRVPQNRSMKVFTTIALLLLTTSIYGQKSLNQLLNNKKFQWLVDSTTAQLNIYYQTGGWTANNVESVNQAVSGRLESTKLFLGITSYDARIHLFIVENREQMKDLINRQTNGAAFPKHNIITGLATEKVNSVNSNHELFHIMAMKLWGTPEPWINEGMAVYSDRSWQGYNLDQLAKYLVDNNRYVSLPELVNKFRSVDDLVSYPLLGSFVKFLDEVYGREVVINIWQAKSKHIEKITGKSLEELEKEWLRRVREADYTEIRY